MDKSAAVANASAILTSEDSQEDKQSGKFVTIRRGPTSNLDEEQTSRGSYIVEDTICADRLRVILREELLRIVDDRLTNMISNAVAERVALATGGLCAALGDRICVLESNYRKLEDTLNRVVLSSLKANDEPVALKCVEEMTPDLSNVAGIFPRRVR